MVLAPIPAAPAALPARRLADTLSVPRLGRTDRACALVLAVPAIVGRPYAHVGIDLPEGRAYRAYFTADFVWEMAVVAEVAKGDMPPRNPYYLGDNLHYYWLMHLLPAAARPALGGALTVEQLLLVNALWSGLTFAGFFYFSFDISSNGRGRRPQRALACCSARASKAPNKSGRCGSAGAHLTRFGT